MYDRVDTRNTAHVSCSVTILANTSLTLLQKTFIFIVKACLFRIKVSTYPENALFHSEKRSTGFMTGSWYALILFSNQTNYCWEYVDPVHIVLRIHLHIFGGVITKI